MRITARLQIWLQQNCIPILSRYAHVKSKSYNIYVNLFMSLKAISSVKEYHAVSKCDDSNYLLTLNPEDISNPLGNLQRTYTFPKGVISYISFRLVTPQRRCFFQKADMIFDHYGLKSGMVSREPRDFINV